MENKTLAYFGLGGALLLLFGTFAMGSMGGGMNGNSVRNSGDSMTGHQGDTNQPVVPYTGNDIKDHHTRGNLVNSLSGEELKQYRSEEIPVDCRLPEYDNNVQKWVEHLSHHENTKYCLEYYNKIIS